MFIYIYNDNSEKQSANQYGKKVFGAKLWCKIELVPYYISVFTVISKNSKLSITRFFWVMIAQPAANLQLEYLLPVNVKHALVP